MTEQQQPQQATPPPSSGTNTHAESVRAADPWLLYQVRRLLTGLCWACFGIGGLLLTFLWFPYLNRLEKNPVRRIIRARKSISASFRFFLKLCDWMGTARFDLSDLERIQHIRGSIIVANHPTILDYVMIASQLPLMDCLVKSALKENFFLKGVVAAANYMLNDASEAVLVDCQQRLAQCDNILIFPEGTRTVPGEPLHLKRGVAHIALRLNAPVVVLFIDAPEKWLSKKSHWYEIPRTKSTLRIEYVTTLNPADFMREGEDGYSLASRRLTRHLTEILEEKLHLTQPSHQ